MKKLFRTALFILGASSGAICASAQNLNSTEIVYSSTFVPFESSFRAQEGAVVAATEFPAGYRRTNKRRIDSTRTVCSQTDLNNDGDTRDAGETVRESFSESVFIGFVINNYGNEPVVVDYLRYQVEGRNRRVVNSTLARPIRPTVIPARQSGSVLFKFVSSTAEGRRAFLGSPRPIPKEHPNRRIVWTVYGHSRSKRTIELLRKDIVSFTDANRCPD